MEILKTEVTSSHIKSVSYDTWMGNLIIEYKNDQVYTYVDVPVTIYEEMVKAESVGRYFRNHIHGVYDFLRLTPKKRKSGANEKLSESEEENS